MFISNNHIWSTNIKKKKNLPATMVGPRMKLDKHHVLANPFQKNSWNTVYIRNILKSY